VRGGDPLDREVFWSAFGAIGTTLGAFATFAAVVVALWQTKFAHRKKLEIFFQPSGVAAYGKIVESFIWINIANTGNRAVTIKEWNICINGPSYSLVDNTKLKDCSRVELPIKLEPEESIDLYCDYQFFIALLQCSYYKDFCGMRRVRIQVRDGTNKVYNIKGECARVFFTHLETWQEALNRRNNK